MADEPKLTKPEHSKPTADSCEARLPRNCKTTRTIFPARAAGLLKHHGSYQQDDREQRNAKDAAGNPLGKAYMFMVRTRIPGGKVSAEQFLAELDLCDQFGNGTLRITTRQGFQLHGVLKGHLKDTIRAINESKLTTLAACGDVSRNVMCCPAPYKNNKLHDELQAMADRVAEHLKPRTTGYYEIWLEDEAGEKTDVTAFKPVEEPIYGERYLPRKFKVAFAFPHDNCVELYANDLGFLAIVENDQIIGYNVLVGGGMGMTPALKKTFPAVAKRMTFVPTDQVIAVAEAIVKVQRDFGNRADRKVARMKYLIANWGLEKFKAKVEEYFGGPLPEPHPADVTNTDDHIGWHAQGDGNWFLGINVENGRIKDEGELRLKTALQNPHRTLPHGNPVDGPPSGDSLRHHPPRPGGDRQHSQGSRREVGGGTYARSPVFHCLPGPAHLRFGGHGIRARDARSRRSNRSRDGTERPRRRAVGHSHDRLPERLCPRPYTPDIGLVGKAQLKYTLYLGGNAEGTRLAFLYEDMLPLEDIGETLHPLFAFFKLHRENGEAFGDFCHRQGLESLKAYAETYAAT